MTFTEIVGIGASVIASLGGGAAIVFGLSNHLGRVWADRALEKQRQEHTRLNLELTHQLGLISDRARHSLQITALEHQVRFSKLHERRAEVIAELYERLVETQTIGERFAVIEGYNTDTTEQQEERRKAEEMMRELSLFIEKHRIYLPERICTSLKNFLDTMWNHVIRVGVYGSIDHPTPQTLTERHQVFEAAYRAFEGEIPAARKTLEDEFRKVLGVENSRLPDSTT